MGRRPNDEKLEVVNIRMVKEPSIYSTEKIRTPDDVLRVVANELATYDREVFKSCILSNSAAFIAIHNHPSGSISPSQEDKDVTQRLLSCSELLGVKMLDHIIVGGETGNMLSFKGIGLLDQLRPTRSVWER